MATVVNRVGRERSPSFDAKRRVHCCHKLSPLVRSPKSVLHPESSMDCSSSESSMILGEQIVECTSFRTPSKTKGASAKLHSKLTGAKASFEQVDSYTWFVSIGQPSDLIVEIDDISLHLHKLPLLSRSGLLFRLASQITDSRKAYINLVNCPGGAEAFIVVAKFCYGIMSDLTATNVATILCVAEYLEMTEAFEDGNVVSKAEYLEMTEAFEDGNVVSKAESFLDLVILNSWQESIIVLQSCELLLPWAENMNLVKRCAQSVALKACTPLQEVRWLFSGIENIENTVTEGVVPQDWWYEDVSHLTIYCFSEVVDAIKEQGMPPSLLGGAIEYYALRWLPGLVKTSTESVFGKTTESSTASTRRRSPITSPRKALMNCTSDENRDTVKVHESIAEQNRNRFILEEIVSMLPRQRDAVSCSFLLRMTRAACMLNCDVECKAELESRAGLQLDQALLSDLLIPCFSHTSEYLYDVDLVRRVLNHFLTQEPSVASSLQPCSSLRSVYDGLSPATKIPQPGLILSAKVAKLMDSYLAEVARDSKLPLSKFQVLAEALPEGARLCDDGLYRALDTYLKIHPMLSEHERKRLCRILNCHRLSLDACTHASQNERLPLRFVVQVLFCEQLKIRSTVTEVSNSVRGHHRSTVDNVSVTSREPTAESSAHPTDSTSCAGTVTPPSPAVQESINQMEIRALQQELATMRIKCNDLVRDQGTIQDQVERISRNSRGRSSSWSSGAWKKINKLHLFSSQKYASASGDSSRTDESRSTNPRRWRNSIS